jgi:signal transduction histidine kinase/ligand-binding sensor protein
MKNTKNEKEFACIAGAYGPVESIPLLRDLIGSQLLDMIVIAYSKLGPGSGILQNDGTVFPVHGRVSLFKQYCQAIRSTEKGRMRCIACDSQAVIKFTGGNHSHPSPAFEEIIRNSPIEPIDRFGLPEEGVYCYRCHAGLLEFVRAISLDLGYDLRMPVGAMWVGQNKLQGYTLSDNEVRRLAKDMDYQNPDKLVALYENVECISKHTLAEYAKSLAETARPIEDSASASFHLKKQAQFDRLSNEVLNSLRKSLSRIKGASTKTIQKQIYDGMKPVLEEITVNIGNCYSAICEIPADADETGDSRIQVQLVSQAGLCKRQPREINIRQTELDMLATELKHAGDFKTFSLHNLNSGFLVKLKNAIEIYEMSNAIVTRMPTLLNKIFWVTLLGENCHVLTPSGNLLPDFVRMLENVLQGTTQIINDAYLRAEQQDSLWALEKQAEELAQKDIQTRLLVENLAHQVSRPVMELKQSAYILSQGFSKDAYASFCACLAELERGCRNFDLYERLTTDFGKRGVDFQTRSSFDVTEIVNQACERVKPFSEVQRVEVLVNVNREKGHTIPKVLGNPQAILEALVNVFHNALKYSIGGYPVEVEISHRESSTVDVRVTNVGIDLRRDEWENIFGERYRADTAKQVAIEGSGLGLYVARKLVTLYDGSIGVQSCVPGKPAEDSRPRWKTTFMISLRCQECNYGGK